MPIKTAGNERCQFGEEAETLLAVVPTVVGPEPEEDSRRFGIGPGNVAHLAVALWYICLVDSNGVHP